MGLSARMTLVPAWGLRTCAALLAVLVLAVGLSAVRLGHAGVRVTRAHSVASGLLALPVSARGAVSADLGRQDPRYRVHRVEDGAGVAGLDAVNPGQHFSERFSSAGVTLSSGRARFSLGLVGAGRDAHILAPPAIAARAAGNRVSYKRGGVREWFVNGPLGLEQGFDVARRPGGNGVLTLAVSVAGASSLRLHDGGALLSSKGGALRYSGLSAVDARGHSLPAWLGLSSGRLMIRVDDRGARYPVRIDPFMQQGELSPSDEVGEGQFGYSVALSADGNTALIGGPGDNSHEGAAWVFTQSGGIWTQQGSKLTGGGEEGEGKFGTSVALSADGETALIGGASDDDGDGAAWVFVRSAGGWTQQGQKLTGGGEESGAGFLGTAVALSSDGATALVGAPGDRGDLGSAWVFVRVAGVWKQQGVRLSGIGESGFAKMGTAVALAGDGETALVGAPGADQGEGAAWVFTGAGESWTQQGAQLKQGYFGSTAEAFGKAVALSYDGNTALIGAPEAALGGGVGFVFERSGGVWSETGGLNRTYKPTEQLGTSVAISSDGSTGLLSGVGSAGVWEIDLAREGSFWEPVNTDGGPIALSADAGTVLIGNSDAEENAGAVTVSAQFPELSFIRPSEGPISGGTQVAIHGSGFRTASAVMFGSVPASFTVDSPSEITAVSPPEVEGTVNVTVLGPGGASRGHEPFTYGPPPLAPTHVQAKAGEGRAVVTFEAPSGIERGTYTVTASPGGAKESIDYAGSVTVSGLTNGTKYTFTVTTTDEFGTSQPSAPSNAIVPGQIVIDGSKRLPGGSIALQVEVPGVGQLSGIQTAAVARKASASEASLRRKSKKRPKPKSKSKIPLPTLVIPAGQAVEEQESATLIFKPTVAALRELVQKRAITAPVTVSFTASGDTSVAVTSISFAQFDDSFEAGSETWTPAWGDLTTAGSTAHSHSGRYSLQVTIHSDPYSAVNTTASTPVGNDPVGNESPLRLLLPGAPISMWVYRPTSTPAVGLRPMVRVGGEWAECRGAEVRPKANRWVRLTIVVPNSERCKGPVEPSLEVHGVGVEIDDKRGVAKGKSLYLDDVSW